MFGQRFNSFLQSLDYFVLFPEKVTVDVGQRFDNLLHEHLAPSGKPAIESPGKKDADDDGADAAAAKQHLPIVAEKLNKVVHGAPFVAAQLA